MKLPVFGFIALLFAVGIGSAGQTPGENAAPSTAESLLAAAMDLKAFAAEVSFVEGELAKAAGVSREDGLVMYCRSSAASGRFDRAAAACAMFLNEYGLTHPYSERMAMRFADCLFPFKFDEVNVVHTPSGPRLDAVWRMGYAPRVEHLRQAVPAFELAASLAQDEGAKGSALLKLGWVHRVLGNWDASTKTWDRCGTDVPLTKSAADALWLAAENLAWTDRQGEAVERLQRMAAEHAGDPRVAGVPVRIEHLQAEARRSAGWLSDPVASLEAEMKVRAPARSPQEAYRSAVGWLQRRGEQNALIVISRWACGQSNWTPEGRIAARFDLVDALLLGADKDGRSEAITRLREIFNLAHDDATAARAALRCCRLLGATQQYDEADALMEALIDRVQGSKHWEIVALSEYAVSLLERGAAERSRVVVTRLHRLHPDVSLDERLEAILGADSGEVQP